MRWTRHGESALLCPVASAMTASPPHREPLSVRVGVGQPQEPAPTAAAPAVLACALQLPRARCPDGPSLSTTRASVALVVLVVIPARCSQADAARAVLPPYAARVAPLARFHDPA